MRTRTLGILIAFLLMAPAISLAAVNDTYFDRQWALARIQAEQSWATSSGRDIVVAVIDTGVDFTHEDLEGRSAGSFTCIDGPCREGGAADHDHGTMVAGVIAAVTNNQKGIAAVAPDAKILSIKVLSSEGQGSSNDVAKGIRFAAERGAKVINLSLGSDILIIPGDTLVLSSAINEAWDRGAAVVAASGNDQGLMSSYAGAQNVVIVGATAANDRIASYSAGSSSPIDVDIYAPGGDGACSFATCITTTIRGGYATAKGTSFAAPHVSGVTAQLMCLGQDNNAAVSRMISTADPIPGGRRVNAAKAVGTPSGSGCAASFETSQPSGAGGTTTGGGTSSRPRTGGGTSGTTAPQTPVGEETPVEPAEAGTPEPATSENQEAQVDGEPGSERKSNPALNLAIAAVLALAVAGGYGWMRWKTSKTRAD